MKEIEAKEPYSLERVAEWTDLKTKMLMSSPQQGNLLKKCSKRLKGLAFDCRWLKVAHKEPVTADERKSKVKIREK